MTLESSKGSKDPKRQGGHNAFILRLMKSEITAEIRVEDKECN